MMMMVMMIIMIIMMMMMIIMMMIMIMMMITRIMMPMVIKDQYQRIYVYYFQFSDNCHHKSKSTQFHSLSRFSH